MNQPIHVVYGGAHLFKADTAGKLSKIALQSLQQNAPDAESFARAFMITDPALASRVRERVIARLAEGSAVQDYRIDFEDGYGPRSDGEEDGHARSAAEAIAEGMRNGTLPRWIGIRVKAFSPALVKRSARTLELFFKSLHHASGGKVPDGFRVTLPKAVSTVQVSRLERQLGTIEKKKKWKKGTLRIELMVETPEALFDSSGRAALWGLVKAARGRCIGAHFGAYDYLSACEVGAEDQGLGHPGCDFARQLMQVSLAGRGVALSDGATTLFPVGSREEIFAAWSQSCLDIRRSLSQGFHQGWDLHPAQLPARYAAVFAHFLSGWERTASRLSRFLEESARAVLHGSVFDDAATGQGILNHVLRGVSSGAIRAEEVAAVGLSAEDLRSRSFPEILRARARR